MAAWKSVLPIWTFGEGNVARRGARKIRRENAPFFDGTLKKVGASCDHTFRLKRGGRISPDFRAAGPQKFTSWRAQYASYLGNGQRTRDCWNQMSRESHGKLFHFTKIYNGSTLTIAFSGPKISYRRSSPCDISSTGKIRMIITHDDIKKAGRSEYQ
jgi:hypothetical protein